MSMVTDPLIYSAIIAVCALAREIIRSRARYHDIALLLKMTQAPDSLRYLVELEQARHPWLIRVGASTPSWLLAKQPAAGNDPEPASRDSPPTRRHKPASAATSGGKRWFH